MHHIRDNHCSHAHPYHTLLVVLAHALWATRQLRMQQSTISVPDASMLQRPCHNMTCCTLMQEGDTSGCKHTHCLHVDSNALPWAIPLQTSHMPVKTAVQGIHFHSTGLPFPGSHVTTLPPAMLGHDHLAHHTTVGYVRGHKHGTGHRVTAMRDPHHATVHHSVPYSSTPLRSAQMQLDNCETT